MAASKDPYIYFDQVGHLLRKAYQRHAAIFQKVIPDSDLTAAQLVTLCAVREQPGRSLNEIVKVTAIDQATIRGVVDRLKARKLVEISSDPEDGRKSLVNMTKDGEKLLDKTIPFAHEVTDLTYGNLSPGERVALQYLLKKMIDASPDM
ncbi:MarR family winged helix-turn-helix transcriptional regulator [Burkholderia sp. BCC1977]|uniref:MarR family winged helix-turn-helix transcriptional regulator n=1 Tax=Burkholderia sp. BCC1977 TaxID=2817440 RepID=UPI002ABE42A1|nr:MarR family winged helix-turn-helix transcriptional regulator [Burkholderia sp. BCC1977]